MVKITSVDKKSRASRVGVLPGDNLISVNGNAIRDVLDYRFYLAEREVELLLERSGERYSVRIKKGEYDDIGLDFETPLMDKKQTCRNKCIFCFIDQNPEGMRETIYFKDDDSRLSFLHGNYITLTNMTDEDVARIVKMRFSPLNISVHTTNPELRVKMMKNRRAGEVLKYLDSFKDAGLEICAQIVLCRGVNDGEELVRTMSDLAGYYPSVTSVSVVPAGLTKFRDKLYPLTDFSREEALRVINTVESFAALHKEKHGTRLFYLADELFLKAGLEIPGEDYYEGYPQIENGVGMLRSLSEEFNIGVGDLNEKIERLEKSDAKRRVAIATGVAAYPTISDMAGALMSLCDRLDIKVYEIKNNFFGESITVSGLLTGKDLYEQLNGRLDCDTLLISAEALRCTDMDFLCGMTLSELEDRLGVSIRPCRSDGFDFIDAVFGE
jgi:putative radical SAM enzyme (TIGR03279 family)